MPSTAGASSGWGAHKRLLSLIPSRPHPSRASSHRPFGVVSAQH